MPRYFFHLHDEVDSPDEEGTELGDAEAARAFAIRSAREIACESIARGYLNLQHYIEVTTDGGEAVLKVRFGEAIEVTAEA